MPISWGLNIGRTLTFPRNVMYFLCTNLPATRLSWLSPSSLKFWRKHRWRKSAKSIWSHWGPYFSKNRYYFICGDFSFNYSSFTEAMRSLNDFQLRKAERNIRLWCICIFIIPFLFKTMFLGNKSHFLDGIFALALSELLKQHQVSQHSLYSSTSPLVGSLYYNTYFF